MTTAETPPDVLAPAPAGLSFPRRRILLVDDNRALLDSQSLLLHLLGQTVLCAPDGPTAIGMVSDFAPEIVLLDIDMPIMSGFEVARALRQIPASSGALIVAHTGQGRPEYEALARAAGFDGMLLKPAVLSQIVQLIKRPIPVQPETSPAPAMPYCLAGAPLS